LPAEQSVVQGDETHPAVQLPDEQVHVPDEQGLAMRDDAVPGSATAGPPFGVLLDVLLLEPPQAARTEAVNAKTKDEESRTPGASPIDRVLATDLMTPRASGGHWAACAGVTLRARP
jgi:hypothetical protein